MRSTSWGVAVWAGSLALALGGCSTVGGGTADVASLAAPAVSPAPVAPEPVVYGAFLDGPVGTRLPDADRTAALAAEDGALSSGERRTWRGAKGVYGFVVPGPASAAAVASGGEPGAPAAECRSFSHTIYFAGRPQTGKGTGCRDVDGRWHVTS